MSVDVALRRQALHDGRSEHDRILFVATRVAGKDGLHRREEGLRLLIGVHDRECGRENARCAHRVLGDLLILVWGQLVHRLAVAVDYPLDRRHYPRRPESDGIHRPPLFEDRESHLGDGPRGRHDRRFAVQFARIDEVCPHFRRGRHGGRDEVFLRFAGICQRFAHDEVRRVALHEVLLHRGQYVVSDALVRGQSVVRR